LELDYPKPEYNLWVLGFGMIADKRSPKTSVSTDHGHDCSVLAQLYAALTAADVPEDKARQAAEEVASIHFGINDCIYATLGPLLPGGFYKLALADLFTNSFERPAVKLG
jgi:hypothetical protein